MSLMFIAAGMLASTPVKAQITTLEIEEQEVPEKGIKFNVTISVTNVVDLWSFGITLVWDPDICNHTGNIYEGDVFEGKPPEGKSPIFVEYYDNTEGVISGIGQTLLAPETGQTGSFSLVIVEFLGKEYGATDLDFDDWPTPTGMRHTDQTAISHTRIPEPVTIVPEFPVHLLMPLFLIATIIAVILAKTAWSKRPRRPRGCQIG